MVEQHAAQHLCGDGEELNAALPPRIMLVAETEPRLVHESGGLERMSGLFATQRDLRLTPELRVYDLHQRLARLGVTGAPCPQELGDSIAALAPQATGIGRGCRRNRWGSVSWRVRHAHSLAAIGWSD